MVCDVVHVGYKRLWGTKMAPVWSDGRQGASRTLLFEESLPSHMSIAIDQFGEQPDQPGARSSVHLHLVPIPAALAVVAGRDGHEVVPLFEIVTTLLGLHLSLLGIDRDEGYGVVLDGAIAEDLDTGVDGRAGSPMLRKVRRFGERDDTAIDVHQGVAVLQQCPGSFSWDEKF